MGGTLREVSMDDDIPPNPTLSQLRRPFPVYHNRSAIIPWPDCVAARSHVWLLFLIATYTSWKGFLCIL